MKGQPSQRLSHLFLACVVTLIWGCKQEGFHGTGATGVKRNSDTIDAGDRQDTLSQNAFSNNGHDGSGTNGSSGSINGAGGDRIPTTIPIARVCSDRYTKNAQTNLLQAQSGVVVKFSDPTGQNAPVLAGIENPQALRAEMIERGTMTVRAPRGVWDVAVCDVRASQCYQEMQGFAALGVGGIGKLGSATSIPFGAGAPASGRLGVLFNINQERQQMFSVFQNVLMQGMFSPGFGLVNNSDVAYCDDTVSPLVIDIAGTGIELTSSSKGVSFDLDADGEKDRISWVKAASQAGFLALDKNENGTIDNGNELFGNHAVGPDGETSGNGFDALAKYDSNKDRAITPADDIWQQLVVWRDRNMDGISQPQELSKLDELGITHIDLTYIDGFELDAYGNWTKERSVVVIKGKLHMVFDVWFRLNNNPQ